MLKITKAVKKKKKGKKSKKAKEEELFKPEELEAYRREHGGAQNAAEVTAGSENEEWKKFLQLTSGVDEIVKKTQGDLNRIKESSFFQRVPTPSQLKEEEKTEQLKQQEEQKRELADKVEEEKVDPKALGIVEVSESESETEEEEDIFDTGYIDALAAGEVKLAYIPESPTEAEKNDPFDTSYAENAILGNTSVAKKGKKLVPIGSAAEVLLGRVQVPTCATQRPAASRRQVLKQRDLLLGSFDDNANAVECCIKDSPPEVSKTLLDEDAPEDLASDPIDLSKTLYIPPVSVTDQKEEDDEFAQLAAENLNKEPVNFVEKLTPEIVPDITQVEVLENSTWDAFGEDQQVLENNVDALSPTFDDTEIEKDPFDTTFAENILPGKAELKQIESEILNGDFEIKKPSDGKILNILNKINSVESSASLSVTKEQDLLGGSNTDLTQLGDRPLTPAAHLEYYDPFDTSLGDSINPKKAELKNLEQELLGEDLNKKNENLSDDDFDPRAEENPKSTLTRERSISRPEVLNFVQGKSVCFEKDVIETELSDKTKLPKPPTPFYVRKSSVPGDDISAEVSAALEDQTPEDIDPFDTSFASNILVDN